MAVLIQDFEDTWVDAVTFIPKNSVRYYSCLAGDINLDGVVDAGDLNIIGLNWQKTYQDTNGNGQQDPGEPPIDFCSGDANFDGIVDAQDINKVGLTWQQTGFADKSADFNRDGVVD